MFIATIIITTPRPGKEKFHQWGKKWYSFAVYPQLQELHPDQLAPKLSQTLLQLDPRWVSIKASLRTEGQHKHSHLNATYVASLSKTPCSLKCPLLSLLQTSTYKERASADHRRFLSLQKTTEPGCVKGCLSAVLVELTTQTLHLTAPVCIIPRVLLVTGWTGRNGSLQRLQRNESGKRSSEKALRQHQEIPPHLAAIPGLQFLNFFSVLWVIH